MLTGAQIRAARALLDWSARELAVRSGVGIATIHRLERQQGVSPTHPRTPLDLRRTFEAAGIVFLGSEEEGVGVQLRPGAGPGRDGEAQG